VYWIELVVDDDFDPDYDAPAKKKSCEKCTVYDNGDDPAARDWLRVIVQGEVRLVSSSPHHIVYRRPPEPLGPPHSLEPIVSLSSPADDLPSNEEFVEEDEEEVLVPETTSPEPEYDELFEPPVSIEPPPDDELENPVIRFRVQVKGYPYWQAQILIYPVGQSSPIATYTTKEYPATETSQSVAWSTIFPDRKPPSGVYTYDILVRGVNKQLIPSPASINGFWDDKRLSEQAAIQGFMVTTHLSQNIGTLYFFVQFRVLRGDSDADVMSAWVEFYNFQLRHLGKIYLSRQERNGEVWWVGSWSVYLFSYEKLGNWEIIACAEVQEDKSVRVVKEARKVIPILIGISGYALGFTVYNGQQLVENETDRLFPYVGWQVCFYAFIKVQWLVGNSFLEVWYSDEAFTPEQLSRFFTWIDPFDDFTIPAVESLPPNLRQLLDLKVNWRRFESLVRTQEKHSTGIERWYGMDKIIDLPPNSALKYSWRINAPGVYHWGWEVSWRMQQNGVNGNAIRHRIVYLYPTDRADGHHLIRTGENPNEEYFPTGTGWVKRVGDERLNLVNVGKKLRVSQRLWLPNPWKGRICARERWSSEIVFAADDPFFDNYPNKQIAMKQQAAFHARLLELAFSFLGVPYAWGGQTYGGLQSRTNEDFTCSFVDNGRSHRIDRVSRIGSSFTGYGYGIDCSGFVGEVAFRVGIPIKDMSASMMQSWPKNADKPAEYLVNDKGQRIARLIAYYDGKQWVGLEYVRPGDFAATKGHVVYILSVNSPTQLQTIEANSIGKVGKFTWNIEGKRVVVRRWINPEIRVQSKEGEIP